MRRWMVGALAAVVCLSGCTSRKLLGPVTQEPVGNFALTERSGRTVSRADLLGKVWVASFIFTHCATQCPRVSTTLARLQHDLGGQSGVLLVSFSVDPEDDTPAVLREYADRYHADPNSWLFLTGDQKEIYDLIRNSFLMPVEAAQGADRTYGNEVGHSTRLVLVDDQGRIQGFYEGETPDDLPDLERDLQVLVWKSRLPTVNAVLNATAAFLLAIGFVAVRRRWLTFHKVCMLTALVVSTLFMTSYLYYHLVVRHGQPKYFPGEGWVRPVYFAILLSHTVLAAVVVPLALITTFLGLSGRWRSHVRIARWTLPLWLYDSITGVVVYWMLYQLYAPS